jgi:hypothetical protein
VVSLSEDKRKVGKKDTQLEKFQRTARELGCSEDEGAFDKALKKLSSVPPPKGVEGRKKKK